MNDAELWEHMVAVVEAIDAECDHRLTAAELEYLNATFGGRCEALTVRGKQCRNPVFHSQHWLGDGRCTAEVAFAARSGKCRIHRPGAGR